MLRADTRRLLLLTWLDKLRLLLLHLLLKRTTKSHARSPCLLLQKTPTTPPPPPPPPLELGLLQQRMGKELLLRQQPWQRRQRRQMVGWLEVVATLLCCRLRSYALRGWPDLASRSVLLYCARYSTSSGVGVE
jgi:hypothetical protein